MRISFLSRGIVWRRFWKRDGVGYIYEREGSGIYSIFSLDFGVIEGSRMIKMVVRISLFFLGVCFILQIMGYYLKVGIGRNVVRFIMQEEFFGWSMEDGWERSILEVEGFVRKLWREGGGSGVLGKVDKQVNYLCWI